MQAATAKHVYLGTFPTLWRTRDRQFYYHNFPSNFHFLELHQGTCNLNFFFFSISWFESRRSNQLKQTGLVDMYLECVPGCPTSLKLCLRK